MEHQVAPYVKRILRKRRLEILTNPKLIRVWMKLPELEPALLKCPSEPDRRDIPSVRDAINDVLPVLKTTFDKLKPQNHFLHNNTHSNSKF